MDLKFWADVGQASAGFFAGITLILYLIHRYSGEQDTKIEKWKQDIIILFLMKRYPEGASVAEIVAYFRNETLSTPRGWHRKIDLTEQAIRLSLARALSSRAVSYGSGEIFSLSPHVVRSRSENSDDFMSSFSGLLQAFLPGLLGQLDTAEAKNRLSGFLFVELAKNPNKYSIDELAILVNDELDHDIQDARAFIMRVIGEKHVFKDSQGKLYLPAQSE